MFKKDPEGYRKLLVYQKAQNLQREILAFVSFFPKTKTFADLADQISRSMRSTTKNIVEGWKRNTTKEYFQFLGFSLGSNSEMMEDLADIATGVYKELMGIKGIMGIMGEKGAKGTPLSHSPPYSHQTFSTPQPPYSPQAPSTPYSHQIPSSFSAPYSHQTLSTHQSDSNPSAFHTPSRPLPPQAPLADSSHAALSASYPHHTHYPHQLPYTRSQLDALKFYPIDATLPPAVKLFLQSKEINLLLYRLQQSLDAKMDNEHTKPASQRFRNYFDEQKKADKEFEEYMKSRGLKRLDNGQYVDVNNEGKQE